MTVQIEISSSLAKLEKSSITVRLLPLDSSKPGTRPVAYFPLAHVVHRFQLAVRPEWETPCRERA